MKRRGDNSGDIDAERLARAEQTSLQTQSISPVLREELRLSIMNRRHQNGQEALKVEFKEPERHELTPTEIEKKKRRREQNRRAARRCREKKKRNQEGTYEGLAQMIEENQQLEEEVSLLKSQKEAIERFLSSHGGCLSVKEEPGLNRTSESVPFTNGESCSSGHFGQNTPTNGMTNPQGQFMSNEQPIRNLHDQDCSDLIPDTVLEFCLEHSRPEESLYFDLGSDMRRQTVSVSSVSSDADIFGMESDTDTLILTSDQGGYSESSEDEDVFHPNTSWTVRDNQPVPLLNTNESYLPLPMPVLNSPDSEGNVQCRQLSYMQFLNFAEP